MSPNSFVSNGPITARPEGISQREWASFRDEVSSFPGMTGKIGTREVVETVAVETFDEHAAVTPATHQAVVPIGQSAGDIVAKSDRAWARWKNSD
jgi:hypothetical protein